MKSRKASIKSRSRRGDGQRALKRASAGLNVSVPDYSDLVNCSPNHAWKQIREGKLEAVDFEGVMSIPAHVVLARSGAQPIAA